MTHQTKHIESSLPVAHHIISWIKQSWLVLQQKLETRMKDRKCRQADREAIKELLLLKDNELRDIGVTRNDVIYVSKRPHKISATHELGNIARRRDADEIDLTNRNGEANNV